MTQVIHKFVLRLQEGTQHNVLMPTKHQIIHVDRDTRNQDDIAIWAIVDDSFAEPVRFQIVGTGEPIPSQSVYVGSVIMAIYMWHVFRIVR